jgi:Family of unknown function (DUF6488)
MSCINQDCNASATNLDIDTIYYFETQTYLENPMKQFTLALFFSMLFFVTPALAGSGHSHGPAKVQAPVSGEVAANRALEAVKELASAGKIDASWAEIKESKVEQKTFNNGPEWVVMYKNQEINDAAKQTLYVFLTLSGKYIAANFTGS